MKKNLILVIMLSMIMVSTAVFAGGASEGSTVGSDVDSEDIFYADEYVGASEGNAVEKFNTSAHGPSFFDREESGQEGTDEFNANIDVRKAEIDVREAEANVSKAYEALVDKEKGSAELTKADANRTDAKKKLKEAKEAYRDELDKLRK